jgi:phosphate-selective porin OprO/OprP
LDDTRSFGVSAIRSNADPPLNLNNNNPVHIHHLMGIRADRDDSTARAEIKNMKTKSSVILKACAAAIIAGTQVPAQLAYGQAVTNEATTNSPALNVDVSDLLKRIDELAQEVKILQRNREVDQETVDDKAKTTPTVTLGGDGLVIRSADSNFVSFIHGYAQADGRFYTGDLNAASDTFLLRRVRPIIEGTVYKQFDYRLMLDFGSGNGTSPANNNALLDDAYVNARIWPDLQIQAGKYKSPVGLERLESTSDLTFVETGFATELTPNYDLGISVHNSLFTSPLAYSVGVFDGAADGASEDTEVDEGKDAVARLFAQPFIRTDIEFLRKLGFGAAGSVGDHTAGTLPTYKTPGQQTFYTYAATVSPDGEQFRVDPQAYYYVGPFGLLGEYILSSQKVKSSTAGVHDLRLNNRAWQIEANYFLTGEEATFKPSSLVRVAPLRPFSLSEGGWGAFEVVARFQKLILDPAAFPTYAVAGSASEADSWGVGLNWYLNRNVKLNLDYETTTFENGSTTIGAVTARDEETVLTRIQFAF